PDIPRRRSGCAVGSAPRPRPAELSDMAYRNSRRHTALRSPVGSPLQYVNRQSICEWAIKTNLPTFALFDQAVENGCLMSYAQSVPALYREAARYVAKILEGAKAPDLPIARPSRFVLAINAKTARSLGLPIPASLLLRSDRVIE